MKPDITSELRAMVREVLRDVMAQRVQAAGATVETVRIASDSDLAAFVARLMDPTVQERVRSGRLRFTLAMPAGAASPHAGAATIHAGPTPLTGVITERTIDRVAAAGVLVLAPDAVLTPLARDRARRLGLKIERNATC